MPFYFLHDAAFSEAETGTYAVINLDPIVAAIQRTRDESEPTPGAVVLLHTHPTHTFVEPLALNKADKRAFRLFWRLKKRTGIEVIAAVIAKAEMAFWQKGTLGRAEALSLEVDGGQVKNTTILGAFISGFKEAWDESSRRNKAD